MQHRRDQPLCALRRRFFPLLIALLGAGPARALTLPDTTAVIGRILIQRRDVFDPALPQYSSFPYPLLNSLHFTTRTQIIRRELLFESGEPLDSHLVEESARNLRKFPFLGQVTITPARRLSNRDTVDVVVTTEDQWTTNPDVVIDRQGDLSRWGIGLEEENFMGFGKTFKMRFLRSTDRTLWRTIYQDPRLLGSRWSLQAKGIIADDGEMGEWRISRPLYSFDTHWSFDGGILVEDGTDRLYDRGQLSASARTHRQTADLSLTRAWGTQGFHRVLSLRLVGESRTFSHWSDLRSPVILLAQGIPVAAPTARRDLRLEGNWHLDRLRFEKRRYIDRGGLVEDLPVGHTASFSIGQAFEEEGGPGAYALFSAGLTESATIGKAHLIILSAAGSAHIYGGHLDNQTFTAYYHHYYQGFSGQTILFGAAYLQAQHMDQPFQLVLGEDVGLRGYRAREFTGDRLLLVNFENRLFTPVKVMTLHLGGAVFFDAGTAWYPGQSARWDDLRTSAGAGLRLAIPKFSDAPVFRLDLAFPLRSARGAGRYSISFSFSPILWSFEGPDARVKRF